MRKKNYISTSSEWTFDLIHKYEQEIGRIAREKFNLDTYPIQIEVISAEQMMDAYSRIGMPIGYDHWTYGKQFVNVEKGYKRGQMGLAYEIVINSNPCIAYLMEENSMTMQALVIAHACYGHNSFFKNNYLFKSWTNADSIIDYLLFAKNYLAECEELYGITEVEETLDACHALMTHGVDRYKRPPKLSFHEEKLRQKSREEYIQFQVNDLWNTVRECQNSDQDEDQTTKRFPEEPQENILYFLEKNAPVLESWQREIVRIVRKIAQYFYPQRQTQVMNEGWATFWHYTIMNELYDEGLVTDEFMLEFLQSHSNVIFQPEYDSSYYTGINPYALGFNMMQDIRRICEAPTDEDKVWFPGLANSNWLDALHFAMRNFKDESFIAQYLSPKLIREFKFFSVEDDDKQDFIGISAIHDDMGYRDIRSKLSDQYNISKNEPNIQIYSVDQLGDRSLTLHYIAQNRKPLAKSAHEIVKHLYKLWGFPVKLEQVNDDNGHKVLYQCPPEHHHNTK